MRKIRHQQKAPQTSRGSSDRTDTLAAVLFPVLMHADLVALVVHAGLRRRNASGENAQRGQCEEDWLHGLLRSVECGARIVTTGFARREQCKTRPDNRNAHGVANRGSNGKRGKKAAGRKRSGETKKCALSVISRKADAARRAAALRAHDSCVHSGRPMR